MQGYWCNYTIQIPYQNMLLWIGDNIGVLQINWNKKLHQLFDS